MSKLIILGGAKLSGAIEISGAKNSAIAIIPAAILVDGVCRIENVPDISDVQSIVNIIIELGGEVSFLDKHTLAIDCTNLNCFSASHDMVCTIRASSYLIGALLGRFGKAVVAMPGGCDFGVRPIDQHIKGFESLGARIAIEYGTINAVVENLTGTTIYMDVVSVGATINLMLASVKAKGVTVIENAAKEPHVVDVANFLTAMGANVKGAGTDVIKIVGVSSLSGGSYSIIPDQIEAGTFMIAAAATRGEILLKNVIPKHLDSISAKLIEMGVSVQECDDSVAVKCSGALNRVNIKTQPYPGFPTDLQPQILTLLTLTKGTSIVSENVWDNRFKYVEELKKMGANITVDGKTAVVEGVTRLTGAPVVATDLRAGAAIVIAGLMADGVTEVKGLEHIDRGYDDLEGKLRSIGGQIIRREISNKFFDNFSRIG